MNTYLLEVGTENLPVEFQNSAETELKETLSTRLQEERLAFETIETFSTPRRIAFIINNLSDNQANSAKIVKGPPASVAFKDSKPTPAAEGFARKVNIPVNELQTQSFDGIEYVIANVQESTKPASKVLQEIIPDIILNLRGSHFMRWENLETRFSRPIRWLTSVYNNESLPVTIAEISSTKNSYGHRFLAPTAIEINSACEYVQTLKNAYVCVEQEKRKEEIIRQLEKIASGTGGIIQPNEKLLNIVTNIVEWPVAILGMFDDKYLSLPDQIITTVMAAHQKYFPIFDIERRALLNYFICINDGDQGDEQLIVKGNQRVLKARLEDAEFYYREDRKLKLSERVESLKGITFQKGLGSMYSKMNRIKNLTSHITDQLGYSDKQKEFALKSAELCKADLITSMVREFTELEGIIGNIYAIKDGENPEIAYGIGEHYLPRSSDDLVPKTFSGQAISIADKLDTIVSVFAIGKSPTGSADPLGLRRAALGIIMIILKNKIDLNLSVLVEKAYYQLEEIKAEPADKVIPQVKDFITQRLRVHLSEYNYRYDAIEAVLNANDPLVSIQNNLIKTKLTDKLINEPDYTPFHESANRLIRILKGTNVNWKVKPENLVHESEKAFYESLKQISPDNLNCTDLIIRLKELAPLIEQFFNDVLVMDKDEAIKQNRLALVNEAAEIYKTIADFSKIVN